LICCPVPQFLPYHIVPLKTDGMKGLAESVAKLRARGRKKVTSYDTAYISVAQLADCPLLTADSVQATAAKTLDVRTVLLNYYH